jgi:hypothetical protein
LAKYTAINKEELVKQGRLISVWYSSRTHRKKHSST